MEPGVLALVVITFVAAFVNGALGYGFSSLTVPVGLVFFANRVLNPALVLVEVFINLYVLAINRSAIRAVWKRVWPIILGLAPGVALGSYLLASLHPDWLKLVTYCLLLPLILIQAAGIRHPIRAERAVGVPFGAGLGFLYSVTTISGPPLAVMFNNQGLVKHEFRAGLALIRVAESCLTAFAYYQLGLFTTEAMQVGSWIVPSVLLGIPLGAWAIRRMEAETFRRICMSFDVWVVGFGLSRTLLALKLAQSPMAYSAMAIAGAVDLVLLFTFFKARRSTLAAA
ncbi:MAG TPA: sulfite exporter TauE/SafE family protein [Burkholderiales bacterium]|nr:sulfite exporter TauE/SafE family protein [Burkholderiales bacterium]